MFAQAFGTHVRQIAIREEGRWFGCHIKNHCQMNKKSAEETLHVKHLFDKAKIMSYAK